MGNQIIKQPDGKFAVLNSNTDTLALWDATKDEVIEWFVELELADLERRKQRIADIVDHVDAGNAKAAYFQFVTTWDEALERDQQHDGEAWKEYRRG